MTDFNINLKLVANDIIEIMENYGCQDIKIQSIFENKIQFKYNDVLYQWYWDSYRAGCAILLLKNQPDSIDIDVLIQDSQTLGYMNADIFDTLGDYYGFTVHN